MTEEEAKQIEETRGEVQQQQPTSEVKPHQSDSTSNEEKAEANKVCCDDHASSWLIVFCGLLRMWMVVIQMMMSQQKEN